MNIQEAKKNVIDGLDYLILYNLNVAASEQESPAPNADMSDVVINLCKDKVIVFREMRNQFENTVTGALL